jgi:enterochelin esterase-like enzyme
MAVAYGLALGLGSDALAAAPREGLLSQWLVCGPFPSADMTVFYQDHLQQLGGEQAAAPVEGMAVTNKGLDGGVGNWYGRSVWRRHQTKDDGYVDFLAMYADTTGRRFEVTQKVAYAFCTVESPEARRVLLEIRTNDALQVWVNHKEVLYNHTFRGGWRKGGVDLVVVDLEKGANPVLVKVGDYRYQNEWGMALRVMEAKDRIYLNREDVLLPQLRVGEELRGWASISLVNTTPERLEGVTIEVRGNDLFAPQVVQAQPLEPEWDSRVAFFIATKRVVAASDSGKAELEVVMRENGAAHSLLLAPEVRRQDQSFTRTYRSEVDGSVQYYSLLVPPSYDGTRPFPLIVVLHGAHVKECIGAYQTKDWAIVMTPYGRGNTGYREIGTNDVFTAMGEVQKEFTIDPDRVYLAGHSMGGHGTWYLGMHYPDRWAALNPMSGYGDYRVGGYSRPEIPDWQVPLYVSRSAIFRVENALHLPVFDVHGAQDDDVTVEQSRRMTAALKQLGYEVVYDEHPDKGHWWGMDFPNATAFLKERVRNPVPMEVVFRTNRLQFNQAYWVRIDAIETVPELARIRARVLAGNQLEVETENVRRFSLLLNGRLVDPRQPVAIAADGVLGFNGAVPVDSALSFEKEEGGRYRLAQGEATGLVKNHQLFGPIIDAYSSPFLYVYGTSGTAADTEANRRAARQDALDWRTWANGNAEIKRDVEVTPTDIEDKNLVLYGGPACNTIVAAVSEELPIRFRGNLVQVGTREFAGDDIGVKMIYPNPLNDHRYVLVNAGATPEVVGWIHRLGDPLYDPLPDYVVFKKSDLEQDRHHVLEAGFFDWQWQIR